MQAVGKILIILGLITLISGMIITALDGKLKWFGSLPLDLNYKNGNTRIFAPIGSMLILSVLFTLLLNIISRFFR